MLNLYEEHTRELLGETEDWKVYSMEWPDVGDSIILRGAISYIDLDDSKKWPENKEKDYIVIISDDDHYAWCNKWEEETGKCWACVGEGKILYSANYVTGVTEYVDCMKCKGTGLSQ